MIRIQNEYKKSEQYLIGLDNVFVNVMVKGFCLLECIAWLYCMKPMVFGAVLYNPYGTHIKVAVAKWLKMFYLLWEFE